MLVSILSNALAICPGLLAALSLGGSSVATPYGRSYFEVCTFVQPTVRRGERTSLRAPARACCGPAALLGEALPYVVDTHMQPGHQVEQLAHAGGAPGAPRTTAAAGWLAAPT